MLNSYVVKIKTQTYAQEKTWLYYSKMVKVITQVVDGGRWWAGYLSTFKVSFNEHTLCSQ